MSVDIVFNSAVVQALGLALFHSLWQAVVVFCLMEALLFWTQRPAIRYRIQYGGLCLLFIAFILTFSDQVQLAHTAQETVAAYQAQDNAQVLTGSLPLSTAYWWQSLLVMHHSPTFTRCLPLIAVGYALGILFMSFRAAVAFDKVFRLRRQLLPVSSSISERVHHLRNLLKIRKDVGIYLAQKIEVPVMLGYIKPVIVLPVALINQLDKQQVEAILLHELAHIRRSDYLLNILQMVMETLLFFNPVVWWLSAAIRKERELACDDMALQYIGTPVKYAQALFALEEARIPKLTTAIALTGNNKKHLLFNRIKRIIEMNNNKKNPQGIAVALVAFMIAVAMIGFFVAGAQDVKKESKKPKPAVGTFSKSTIVVKDEDGKVPTYEEESSSDDDARKAVAEAMNEMKSALSQIDEQVIKDYTKTASEAFNAEEIKKAMKEAAKELENIDWKEMNKSVKQGLGAVRQIDWEAIGESLDEGLKAIEGINSERVEQAMEEIKKAMEDVGQRSDKTGFNDEAFRKNQQEALAAMHKSLAQSRAELSTHRKQLQVLANDIRAVAKEEHAASLEQHRKALHEHKLALKQHTRSLKKHEKAMRVAEADLKHINKLLNELKDKKLIADTENVNVRLTNDALYIDGQKQSPAVFENLKQYAPQGKQATVSVQRSRKSN